MGALNIALPNAVRPRLRALAELWRCRDDWRLPLPRRLLRRERDAQLDDLMPVVALVALMVGVPMFVTLAPALGDSYPTALTTLWPLWAIQAAPLTAALLLVLRRAPSLALELTHRQDSGEFATLALLRASPASYPCLPLLLAHAWVVAAASCLLVCLTLLFGLLAGSLLAVGDPRHALDLVLGLVSPLAWLRGLFTAFMLGALGSLASMLLAWPGTQSAAVGLDAHRLGLRAMFAGTLAAIAGLVALNWLFGLFGA